jgi:uncharacterized protein
MPRIKLRASGRGRSYSRVRGAIESVQSFLYAKDWPARLIDRLPGLAPLEVVRHKLALGRAERPALRVAFASDLHLGPLTSRRLLAQAFDALAREAPDVLVLGGDYVFLDVTSELAGRLERLVASVPAATKVAVLGNHDLWTDHAMIEAALQRAGARVLVNAAFRLPPPHDDVAIVGLDDPWTGEPDPARAFGEAAGAPLTLAVVHAPEGYPFVRGRNASLMLCGHTHGGQIAGPKGPIVVYGDFGRRWPAGRYEVEGMTLFVSRGVGTVDLPVRLFAPPDVSIFTIR